MQTLANLEMLEDQSNSGQQELDLSISMAQSVESNFVRSKAS